MTRCVTTQMPADLAAWLERKAQAQTISVSAVLRGLVIQARAKEGAGPIMDDDDARAAGPILTPAALRAAKRGGRR